MNGTSPRIRITVTCGTCHERLTTVAKPYERRMKCPECEAIVHVAAYDPIEAEFRRRLAEPRNVDPGVYNISRGTAADEPAAPQPETATIKCPTCLSLLQPEIRDEAWTDTCPDCLEEYRVPPRSELPKKPEPIVIPDPGRYRTGAASKPTPLNTEVFERISEIKEVTIDPPPKWTFFSQVYRYPWSTYVLSRWVWMSVGWALSWFLVAFAASFILSGDRIGVLIGAFFCLPAFWLSFWALSYSSACALTVLEGTAAGQQTITEWPEPDWRDWAANLLYLTFIASISLALSLTITRLAAVPGLEWYLSVVTMHMLYPIVLLSALETTNPFWPVSKPVLHSMLSHARFWLLYFLISCSLTAAFLALVVVSAWTVPFVSALWIGPLTATLLILQARLLGRLGWRTVVEPDGGKKRLKKMAKIQRMKEEPLGRFEPIPPESTSL